MALSTSVIRLGSSSLCVVRGLFRVWVGVALLTVAGVLLPLLVWWATGAWGGDWRAVLPLAGVGSAFLVAPFVLGDFIWLDKKSGLLRSGALGLGRQRPLASIRAVRLRCPGASAPGWYALGLQVDEPEKGEVFVGSDLCGSGPFMMTPDGYKRMARRLADFLGVPLEEEGADA